MPKPKYSPRARSCACSAIGSWYGPWIGLRAVLSRLSAMDAHFGVSSTPLDLAAITADIGPIQPIETNGNTPSEQPSSPCKSSPATLSSSVVSTRSMD